MPLNPHDDAPDSQGGGMTAVEDAETVTTFRVACGVDADEFNDPSQTTTLMGRIRKAVDAAHREVQAMPHDGEPVWDVMVTLEVFDGRKRPIPYGDKGECVEGCPGVEPWDTTKEG